MKLTLYVTANERSNYIGFEIWERNPLLLLHKGWAFIDTTQSEMLIEMKAYKAHVNFTLHVNVIFSVATVS